MKKEKPTISMLRQFVPGRQYRDLRDNVVDCVEHKFEEGPVLYPRPVRGQDATLVEDCRAHDN
jgi:hypothetical protein